MTELDHRPDSELEESDRQPVPVDLPPEPKTVYATVTGIKRAERRPIVPAWMRNREQRREVLHTFAEHGLYMLGYHTPRSPYYVLKLAFYTPRGVWRALDQTGSFATDGASTRPVKAAAVTVAVERKNFDEYYKVKKIVKDHVHHRAPLVTMGALVLLAACSFALIGPLYVQIAAITLAVSVFGRLGQSADNPIIKPALLNGIPIPKAPSSDMIVKALRNMGIKALADPKNEIHFAHPIAIDGPGWVAEVDLPLGATAGEIIEKRTALSSALRRPRGCVWPEYVPEVHDGRLRLYVSKQDMNKAAQPAWPLLKSGETSIFDPFPFGTDVRGRRVTVTLIYENMLIGAKSGVGKTFATRLLALGAALDAYCELRIFDFKGNGDWLPLEPICHSYAQGQADTALEQGLLCLQGLVADCERRAETLSKLPRELCPEGKITPELARRKNLGLHPIVAIFDECQNLFIHPEYGKEAKKLAEKLIRLGRAAGIILILATQRPDSESISTGITANAGIRFCLRVMDQQTNDMILGTSAYKRGIRSTMFTNSDLGIGYLLGADDEPTVTRTYFVDGPMADRVVARALKMRQQAGTLTGMAAGEPAPEPGEAPDHLMNVRTVFATCRVEKIWSETLLGRLTELWPGVYTGWTPETLSAALRGQNELERVGPTQVSINNTNRQGYKLEHVLRALDARDQREIER